MYFQNLENLKTDDAQLKVLDEWLALLSPMYYRNINPIDFALMYKIEYKRVLLLFNEAKKAGVLKVKFIVRDDDRMPVGTYEKLKDIPKSFYNYEKNRDEPITEEKIELWFELVERPKYFPPIGDKPMISKTASNLADIDKQEGGILDLINDLGWS